jgi:hypothetical protein
MYKNLIFVKTQTTTDETKYWNNQRKFKVYK